VQSDGESLRPRQQRHLDSLDTNHADIAALVVDRLQRRDAEEQRHAIEFGDYAGGGRDGHRRDREPAGRRRLVVVIYGSDAGLASDAFHRHDVDGRPAAVPEVGFE
jgi:hypothetical protein